MALIQIIQPRRFHSRRWERSRFWAKEIAANPRRSANVDNEMTEAAQQALYEYCKANDMIEPTTRAGRNKINWESKRALHDHRIKRVHHAKVFRFISA